MPVWGIMNIAIPPAAIPMKRINFREILSERKPTIVSGNMEAAEIYAQRKA